MAFSLGLNFKSNQTVSAKTPMTGQYYSVPHDLTFSDISLDGTYMGWVGGLQKVEFENIQSQRYGDLQDASGGTVGGVQLLDQGWRQALLPLDLLVTAAKYRLQCGRGLNHGLRVDIDR